MKPIQWGPFLLAILVVELIQVGIVLAFVAAFAPSDEAMNFASRLTRFTVPTVGTLAGFFAAAKIGRRSSMPVQQGLLLGAVLAVADTALILISGMTFAWIFVLSNVMKIMGSGAGGALAAANKKVLRAA
jgi:hypothetical protein